MRTNRILIPIVFLSFLVLFITFGCEKLNGGNAVIFYLCDDCGYGDVTVNVDGNYIGTLTSYLLACNPTNNAKDNVVRTIPGDGTHTYEAHGSSGGSWTGTFSTKRTKPVKIALECSGTPGGGGGGGSDLPSDYDNQGSIIVRNSSVTICARDWDLVDGDVVTLIVNGRTIASNVEMTGQNKCWNYNGLAKGKNWIGVICNSPGTTTAASPRIEINDGSSTQGFSILSYPNDKGGYVINFQL